MTREQRIQRIRDRANEIGRKLADHEATTVRHAAKHGYSASKTLRHIASRKSNIIRRVKPLVASLAK